MANTKKKVRVNSNRISFLYEYRDISQAELARRVYEQKTGLTFSEEKNKNYISDFNKLFKRGEMMLHDVQAISQVLDCHPSYILGTINEKAEEVHPLLFGLSEEEFIKSIHWRQVSHEEYIEMRNMYLIDNEGYFVPPYRDYEYEEQRSLNIQDFKHWLLSINMFENPDFIEEFPSNTVLESILSSMDQPTMQLFQGHLIDCVLEYLTEEGYIHAEEIDYSKLSEEEIDKLEEEANRHWVKKQDEGRELYRKRKGELNNGKKE